eukprot:9172910-Pyramimonas_sp.AAC.1
MLTDVCSPGVVGLILTDVFPGCGGCGARTDGGKGSGRPAVPVSFELSQTCHSRSLRAEANLSLLATSS